LSDQGQSAAQEVAPDNIGNDVRAAINELKVGSETPQIDVVIDKGEPGRTRGEDGKFVAQPKDETPKRETLTLKDKRELLPLPTPSGTPGYYAIPTRGRQHLRSHLRRIH